MKSTVIATTALVLFASGTMSPAFSKETRDSPPEVKTYHGIPYVSGGFGVEERENLRAMSKGDNLELSFALRNKDYLDGAEVLIKDRNGRNVLKTFSDGPLFLVKLPQGTYTVEATAMGQTQEQRAIVQSNRQAELYFAWPESKEQPQSNTLARR